MTTEAKKLSSEKLIKPFEGLRLKAYLCDGGKWTIGYGSTKGVRRGMEITAEEANSRLVVDLEDADNVIDRHVDADLNVNQRAALISFIFNLGASNFVNSTLLKKLNKGDYKGAANQLPRWVYAKKKKLRGLVRRRKAERKLFLTPVVTVPQAVKVKKVAKPVTAGAIAGGTAVAAVVPDAVNQIVAAAPAIDVVKDTAVTAQDNPTGLIIVVLLAVIAIGGFIMWRKMKSMKEVGNV